VLLWIGLSTESYSLSSDRFCDPVRESTVLNPVLQTHAPVDPVSYPITISMSTLMLLCDTSTDEVETGRTEATEVTSGAAEYSQLRL